MSVTQTAIGGAVIAGVLQVVITLVVPERPPIDILSVEWTGAKVLYTRRVNASETIRAAYRTDVVDAATERSVGACVSEGWSDYGPDEDQEQPFPLEIFATPECDVHLVAGSCYEMVATVIPPIGKPDTARSPRYCK